MTIKDDAQRFGAGDSIYSGASNVKNPTVGYFENLTVSKEIMLLKLVVLKYRQLYYHYFDQTLTT